MKLLERFFPYSWAIPLWDGQYFRLISIHTFCQIVIICLRAQDESVVSAQWIYRERERERELSRTYFWISRHPLKFLDVLGKKSSLETTYVRYRNLFLNGSPDPQIIHILKGKSCKYIGSHILCFFFFVKLWHRCYRPVETEPRMGLKISNNENWIHFCIVYSS